MTLDQTTVDLVQAEAGAGPRDLAVRQLVAIDAFHRARRRAEHAAGSAAGSRESRLDAARRLDVVRRQHAAIVARTDASLRASHEVVERSGRPRAVVVHRSDWFGRTVSVGLVEQGFRLLAQLDNGADAVGAVIAEQPELLLIEDPLPMMTGEQVLQEVRRYSPDTVVAVQTSDSRAMAALLEAGAGSVFTRQVAPLDVARDLAALLGAQPLVSA